MFFEPVIAGTPKCYAHRIGGCSSKITGEHVFTASVMGKGGLIGMEGFPNVPDSVIGMSSATAKVLCSDHNWRLSPLDEEAKKLSDALGQFHGAASGIFAVDLDGPLFERWLLKVGMGYLAAGLTRMGRQYPSSDEIVSTLFGLIPMAAPMGTYSVAGVDRWARHRKEVLFREIMANDPAGQTHVVGALVALHGFPCFFSFGGPLPDETTDLDPYDRTKARFRFHPPFLAVRDQGQKQLVIRFARP